MEKKYQIFVSSTFEDLKEERKKVQDIILSMYHFPIGMEMFSAADEEQWEVIKETIDSSDYYVLIIANRYGTVIKEGSDKGISYTEKEYRYAKSKNIPILAFIIDKSVPRLESQREATAETQKKLNEFIKEVETGRMVQWWKSADDLALKVMNSLNKQMIKGKRTGWIRTTDSTNESRLYKEEISLIKENKSEDNKFYAKVKQSAKVFVSYSWFPDSNKEWVKRLVQRLESDGVEVVIDYKDLKLGHDKYAFMERIANDNSIKKVLIICNKSYKEKADSRSGGVGDESTIITSQLYGNLKQEKFIPIVNEYDEDGKPYLPNYLSSRLYADLTEFDVGYKELLKNIIENN